MSNNTTIANLGGANGLAASGGSALVGTNQGQTVEQLFAYHKYVTTAAELTTALALAVSDTRQMHIICKPDTTFTFTSGITIDHSYVTIDGNGSLWDFSAMTTGDAVTITASINPPWTQAQNTISRIHMTGPGAGSAVRGIVVNDSVSVGEGPSHIAVYSPTVRNFLTGWTFADRAYIIFVFAGDTHTCGTGIYCPAGSTDGGENITFIGGATYNCSTVAIDARETEGTLNFTDHSIDYNYKQINIAGSRVFFKGGHIEADDYLVTPVTVTGNGGYLNLSGASIPVTSAAPNTFAQFFDIAANCRVVMDSCFANNALTTSGAWATGAGQFTIRNCSSFSTHQNPYLAHTSRSRLVNGTFAAAISQDNIYISEDTGSPSTRTNGTNIDLAVTGGQLVATKNFGVGSPGSFDIAVPVRAGEQMGTRLYYSKPGTETGTMFISIYWAILDQSSTIPTVSYLSSSLGTVSVPFTSASVGSTAQALGSGALDVAPEYATHYILRVALGSCDAGTYNFDTVQMDCCG